MPGNIKRGRYIDNRKGQTTLFIIVAIILILGIILFFLFRGEVEKEEIPKEFRPIENKFLSCLQSRVDSGISIMGEQGGYIYLPEFEPGNSYMPTSSQLGFMGSPIPYWHYFSRSGSVEEQVPTKSDMEEQLERYVEENLDCDFSEFRRQGYEVDVGEKEANIQIEDSQVKVSLNAELQSSFGNKTIRIEDHDKNVDSELGNFYNIAKRIYNKERSNSFLEDYTLDVLYLYAPVTGVELDCAPKVWTKNKVKEDIVNALEANIGMLRPRGYSGDKKYFNLDMNIDKEVQFLYSKDWPTKIETGSEGEILKAEPVGNQPGMGILGFCYVPYHFVYDIVHPVMVQIYDGDQLFQFPVTVMIDNNKPSSKPIGSVVEAREEEVCKYKNNEVTVKTYSNMLEPVEASIKFKCFNQICDIGETKIEGNDAVLTSDFPQCVNGYIIAEADGYRVTKKRVSTNSDREVNLIMERKYDKEVELKIAGETVDDKAVISFIGNDSTETILWPSQDEVELSEGRYEVNVQIFGNGSIYLSQESTHKCIDVNKPGIMGMFGRTEEKCYNLNIPGQEINNVIKGGGSSSVYITHSQLRDGKMIIRAQGLETPKSIKELRNNYEKLEESNIYLDFENE